MVKSLENNHLD